jgi:hypothetical protein
MRWKESEDYERTQVTCLQAYIEELELECDRDCRVLTEMQDRHWEELCEVQVQFYDHIRNYRARIEALQETVGYQASMLDHKSDKTERHEVETDTQGKELE